eukprot:42581_1
MYALVPFVLATSSIASSTCGRHRKPWHLLTNEEQMLYVTGFKQLRSNGVLDVFIETHHLADTPTSFADVHFTGEFFPWHSYFLTEIETQIRNLGEAYECFSLPYWDFTNDAGYDDANQMPIYNSVLGKDGNRQDFCVQDALWSRDVYPTTYLCSEMERTTGSNCCLKRHHGIRGHIPGAETMAPHIYSWRRWKDFQDAVVKEHTFVHGYVSANDNRTHMFGHNAAEDPLFILLHNFLMYLRALRTTCFGYDRVINELEKYQPYAYDPYQANHMADSKPFVDRPMDFNVLHDQKWSKVYTEEITVRKMFDLAEFDISYERGSFWHDNVELQKYCADNLNETWFYDTVEKAEKQHEIQFNWNTQRSVDYYYRFVMYTAAFVVMLVLGMIGCIQRNSYDKIRTPSGDVYDARDNHLYYNTF